MLNNLKMRTKLLILSIPMMILICVVGYIGYYFNSKSVNQMDEMYNKRLLPVAALINARNLVNATDADSLRLITYNDKSSTIKMDDVAQNINTRLSTLDEFIANYEKNELSSYENDRLGLLKQTYANYKEYSLKIIEYVKKGDIELAKIVF